MWTPYPIARQCETWIARRRMHSTSAFCFIQMFALVCRDIGYLGRFILPSNLGWELDTVGADYATGGGNEETEIWLNISRFHVWGDWKRQFWWHDFRIFWGWFPVVMDLSIQFSKLALESIFLGQAQLRVQCAGGDRLDSWERRKTSKTTWYHPENNWGPIIDNLVQFEAGWQKLRRGTGAPAEKFGLRRKF